MDEAAQVRTYRRRRTTIVTLVVLSLAWMAAWGWFARPPRTHFRVAWQRTVRGYHDLDATADGTAYLLSEGRGQQLAALSPSGRELWKWEVEETPPTFREVVVLPEGIMLLNRPYDALLVNYAGSQLWQASALTWVDYPAPERGDFAAYIINSHWDWIGLDAQGKIIWRLPRDTYGRTLSVDKPTDPIRLVNIGPAPWADEYSAEQHLAFATRDGFPADPGLGDQRLAGPIRQNDLRTIVSNGEDTWVAGQSSVWRVDELGNLLWLAAANHNIPFGEERGALAGETFIYQHDGGCQIVLPDGALGANVQIADDICGLAAWRDQFLVGTLRPVESRLSDLLQFDQELRLVLACYDIEGRQIWEEPTGLTMPEAPPGFLCAGDMLYITELYEMEDYYSFDAHLVALELRR